MKQLSFVDLNYLISEFKILENSRIDNFYYEDSIFYIKCYVKGKGHKLLTNKVSKYIFLGDSKEESSHPNSFIQYLRKYLRNGFITKIEQIPNERIIKLSFEVKNQEKIETYYLYLELFANGNIIICDENNVIKNSLIKKKFKDRDVMVRSEYELPPAKELTLDNLTNLEKELKESDLSIVKFLALKFGIGGKYAEEICVRLKIDKNDNANTLKDTKKLSKELSGLLSHKVEAYSSEDGNFYPFKFESVSGIKKSDSFNEIVKNYYEGFKDEKDHKSDSFTKDLKKLQNRLEKQQKTRTDAEEDYEKYNSMGNKIYENYALIEQILNEINIAAKAKGWDYVSEKIKSDPKLSKIIKKLNYKNNEIILDL